MERRKFLKSISICGAALSLAQLDLLAAAKGFHEEGPYNGPLLTSFVNTTCGACPGGCGIHVRKVDDIPVGINGNSLHPINRGGLCPVGISSLAFLIHPDRVKTPLLRSGPRGSNEFAPISWEEAENLITQKLRDLKSAGNPEQFLFVDSRESGIGMELARKFTYDLGSPNFYHSYNPNIDAAAFAWGGEGTDFRYDLENTRVIFCFGYPVFESGNNPVYYASLRNRLTSQPEGERGSFYIFDPRLSASAAKAERWVPIKPNTYGLLALGMLNLIIREELYDSEVVRRYCVGFEDGADRRGNTIEGFKTFVLKNYSPSVVAEKTGVPVDQIITLARLFATTPRTIAVAGDGACQTKDGVPQTWAIMALNALTGKFGKIGGIGTSRAFPYKPPKTGKVRTKPIVSSAPGEYPFLSGDGSIESLPERILSNSPYQIKVAFFNNINLIYSSPQSKRFRQAFQNIPFSVVFTSLHNETSVLADLILPDCTFLEKDDLSLPSSDFPHPVISLTQPVTTPLYEARQTENVLLSLSGKLLGEDWQKWSNYRSYLESKLEEIYDSNTGSLFSDEFKVSFTSLLAERGWRRHEYKTFSEFSTQIRNTGGWWSPPQGQELKQEGFPTASGKFYLNYKILEKQFKGSKAELKKSLDELNPNADENSNYILGVYRNTDEHSESQYPFALCPFELTTVRGEGGRLKDMADMVGHYQYIKWHSWVELNPETAHSLKLSDGQMVWVESPNGKQQLKLIYNSGLMPEVASVPVGLGKNGRYSFGKNINNLFSNARDILTGMPACAEVRVKIYA